jgi:acetate kinase
MAQLALDVYCYRIKKYIGSYAAIMNGLDALVFTAGVGENAPIVRSMSCRNLEYLGIGIDEEKNHAPGVRELDISSPSSKVKVLCIPTNEELVIARDTERVVKTMTPALSQEAAKVK